MVLSAAAVARAHVLVVEVPGARAARAAVEAACDARGWVLAASPADADVLAVAGALHGGLGDAVATAWEDMPGPRVRVDVAAAPAAPALRRAAEAALDTAAAVLADTGAARADAAGRPAEPPGADRPLASGDDDRDGLEMDVLPVPLGPVVPAWPAGLRLRVVLAGDVLRAADVEVPDPLAETGDGGLPVAARDLDAAAGLLRLAGWEPAARRARALRDAAAGLREEPDRGTAAAAAALRRRVRRSPLLRWSLRGLGTLRVGPGTPPVLVGDVHDRLLARLDRAAADLAPGAGGRGPDPREERAALAALPDLVTGLDVAAARLVVASLDPDLALAGHPEETEAARA